VIIGGTSLFRRHRQPSPAAALGANPFSRRSTTGLQVINVDPLLPEHLFIGVILVAGPFGGSTNTGAGAVTAPDR